MKPLTLPKEQREHMIAQIQHFFEMERGESIGDLAADSVLDFFLQSAAPFIYNQALADCRTTLNERMAGLEEDIYALEQHPPLRPRR